jgi:hypothetical protein
MTDFLLVNGVEQKSIVQVESELKAPFPATQVKWRVGSTTKDKSRGLALAYIDARDGQNRMDEVVGFGNWQVTYSPGPAGGVMATVSVRIQRADGSVEWVGRSDGADTSQVEAIKGGFSDALRRTLSAGWGVGRYLYDLPQEWVALDDYKRIQTPPKLPAWALPDGNAQKPTTTGPGGNGNGSDSRTLKNAKLKPQKQPKAAANIGPHRRSDKEVALMEDLGFNVPDEERKNPKAASTGTPLPAFVPQKVRDKFATIEELPAATLEYFVTKWKHQGSEQEDFVAICKQLLMEPA